MASSFPSDERRPPAGLLATVLLLGTVLALWGTRDYRHLFGEPTHRPMAAAGWPALQNIQSDSAVLARGFQIEQRECAGCHETTARSSGPSYQEILNFYRHQSPLANGKSQLISALAAAAVHPQPGWANFEHGPAEADLSVEDRFALASWIVNVGQKKSATEGAGQ
jgi:cytochrome c551/c552